MNILLEKQGYLEIILEILNKDIDNSFQGIN
jgi:hypothetical protein